MDAIWVRLRAWLAECEEKRLLVLRAMAVWNLYVARDEWEVGTYTQQLKGIDHALRENYAKARDARLKLTLRRLVAR